MKRPIFNMLAGLSLLVCVILTAIFVVGIFFHTSGLWYDLHGGKYLNFNSDEVMLLRSDGGGGFPVIAEVFYLWIAIPAAALPIRWLLLQYADRKKHRSDRIVCTRCGYDLRATPCRCPECGTVPEPVKSKP